MEVIREAHSTQTGVRKVKQSSVDAIPMQQGASVGVRKVTLLAQVLYGGSLIINAAASSPRSSLQQQGPQEPPYM